MAITKKQILAYVINAPLWECISTKEKNVIKYKDQEYYVLVQERKEFKRCTIQKLQKEVWRVPVKYIIPYTAEQRLGFEGISNPRAIEALENIQKELKENFIEVARCLIRSKMKFYNDMVDKLGAKFIWNPIDNKELKMKGFIIYRKK